MCLLTCIHFDPLTKGALLRAQVRFNCSTTSHASNPCVHFALLFNILQSSACSWNQEQSHSTIWRLDWMPKQTVCGLLRSTAKTNTDTPYIFQDFTSNYNVVQRTDWDKLTTKCCTVHNSGLMEIKKEELIWVELVPCSGRGSYNGGIKLHYIFVFTMVTMSD